MKRETFAWKSVTKVTLLPVSAKAIYYILKTCSPGHIETFSDETKCLGFASV